MCRIGVSMLVLCVRVMRPLGMVQVCEQLVKCCGNSATDRPRVYLWVLAASRVWALFSAASTLGGTVVSPAVASSPVTFFPSGGPSSPGSQLQYRGSRSHAGAAAATLGDREFVWALTSWMAQSDRRYEEQARQLREQSEALAQLSLLIEQLATSA